MSNVPKLTLSDGRRRLVELMQRLNFGRIEGLIIRDGDPVLDGPAPRVLCEVKFGAENGPRRELDTMDFSLKAQVVELFLQFEAIGHGIVECLVVRHGLPFSMNVRAAA